MHFETNFIRVNLQTKILETYKICTDYKIFLTYFIIEFYLKKYFECKMHNIFRNYVKKSKFAKFFLYTLGPKLEN